MLTIDGAFGEGGGQILRTSLGLALVTGKSFRIQNIRGKRKKPGLLRQHLTAVNAAAEVGRAEVTGAELGSRQVTFAPGGARAGAYDFAVGTAGSATLVLQTVLPALLVAGGPSTLTLEGGTHNPSAPPFDFLQKTFLPLVNRMGPRVTAELDRPGFYPAGGGRFRVYVEPRAPLSRLDLTERGAITARRARALVAGLPAAIAARELAIVRRKLSWAEEWLQVEEVTSSRGPGNVLFVEIACERVTEVFTGFGERGVRAESVADAAVKEARAYLAAGVAAGEYLADQLLVPMALAGGGSFTTLPLSLHATTNIAVIKMFLDRDIEVTAGEGKVCRVEVKA